MGIGMSMSLCPSANETAHQHIKFHLLTDALMHTLPKVHGTLIPAPQAANYTHKGGVHTCPSIPKNAVTTVKLEDLPKSKNPTLTPLPHYTDSNAFTLT